MLAARTGRLRPFALPRGNAGAFLHAVTPLAMLVIIGVECALLAAFLPGTVERLAHGPVADFHNLYQPARDRELAGLYSPALVLILQPLAFLPEMTAYRVMFCANVAAAAGIGFVAQRGVSSLEAKIAVALAPLALPQMHWAIRLGHITPVLAMAALAGLLLLPSRPRLGALLLATMSLKPQYLVAPAAYLLWRRSWTPLIVLASVSASAAAVGLLLVGPAAAVEYVGRYLDWGPNSTDNLLPVQQSWLISWTGVQISFGREANPLITVDLILFSLAVALFAWLRVQDHAAHAVVALMFVPLTPYAQFYDGALVLVAIALILRTELHATAKFAICSGLYLAAVVTQSNVIFPTSDVLGDAHTDGAFWLTPAMVLAAAAIVVGCARWRVSTKGRATW